MPGSYLRLRFLDDGDGTGKLVARAANGGFAGEGGAYFSISELEEFGNALGKFPFVPEDKRLSISSGFGTVGNLEQEHLGITVYSVSPQRGT